MGAKTEQNEIVKRALAMLQAPEQEIPSHRPAQAPSCFSCGTTTEIWEVNRGTCWAKWVCRGCQGKVRMPSRHLCDPALPLTALCRGGEASSWLCPRCEAEVEVEEVDGQGRTFWVCPHCQATGVTPREPGQPYTPRDRPSPLRELYRKATAEIPPNFPLIDGWLAEHHPSLWRKIRDVDATLCWLEQEGVDEEAYQVTLEELLSLCQKAARVRKQEIVKARFQ